MSVDFWGVCNVCKNEEDSVNVLFWQCERNWSNRGKVDTELGDEEFQ
jgi:hypothetical protein